MQKVLNLRVDYDEEAGTLGYLRFRSLAEGQHVARTHRLSDDVFVDFDDESQVLGIEFLTLATEALEIARRFTEQYDLEFPKLLNDQMRIPA